MGTIKEIIKSKQGTSEGFQKTLSYLYYVVKRNKKKIKGRNNQIHKDGAYLSNVEIFVNGNGNSILIEPGARLSNLKIYINGDNHSLFIGQDCYMKKGVIWFEDHDCEIKIKQKTTIMGANISVVEPRGKVSIGEDCMFSFGIDIRNSDSHSILDLATNERINCSEDVIVDDHVWIGHEVQLLKGTRISKNSVVGSRSIVTKSFDEENIVIVGTPAKIVRRNVKWTRERIYK